MKYNVEKKGETYMVVNDTTGEVKALLKTEGEAKIAAQKYQHLHDSTVVSVSARLQAPKDSE